jgi:hypothetical protein
VSLLRRKPLKVNVDFKLDVLTDRVDSVRRLVFAQKIFLTSLEEPRNKLMINFKLLNQFIFVLNKFDNIFYYIVLIFE